MNKAAIGIVELKACRRCNSECRVQTFPANGALQTNTTLWMCANSIRLGGQCDEDAYLTAEAWNTRTPDPIIMEMVEALELSEQFLDKANALASGEYLSSVAVLAERFVEVRDQARTLITKVRGK